MFRKLSWLSIAVFPAAIACCTSVSAQMYSAPNVGTVQNYFGAPSIATRTAGLQQQIKNAGYGGMQAPSNSPAMSSFGGRVGLGVNTSSSGGAKPFSSYSTQPTVSPYLNLFRNDLNGQSDFNYSTLVKPQLQQLQTNQQLERQNIQTNRRLTSIAAQADSNQQGSKDEYPTGHQTVFNYMGHYYQTPVAHRKKAGQ